MNSKKKKNRQHKTPNPVLSKKEEVIETLSPPDVINPEIGSVVEERVPNIVSENVAAEAKETGETPNKPKRNKGKKKKEDDKAHTEDEVKTEEPISDYNEQPIKDTLDESTVAPIARKKKNKNKKGQGLSQEEKKEESKINDDAVIVERGEQAQEEAVLQKEDPEQDTKTAKKKNKRKKNRNDSERSDKIEEIPCTSAFQKLMTEDAKLENSVQSSVDHSRISEGNVTELEIGSPSISSDSKLNESLQKDDVNLNKKKSKKDKKQSTLQAVPVSEEQTKLFEVTAANALNILALPSKVFQDAGEVIVRETPEQHEVSVPSSSTGDDNSLKDKAKIAKPVEKKKEGSENLEKSVSEPKSEPVEEEKVFRSKYTESAISEVVSTDNLDDVVIVPLTEMTLDWHEEVKVEEGNGPIIGCEDKNEANIIEHPIPNHKKNRNRKKSPKPHGHFEVTGRHDTTKTEPILEETLLEPSCNATETRQVKCDVEPEENTQEKKAELQEDKMKNILISKGKENRDKGKKSPNSPKPKGQSGTSTLDQMKPETNSKSSKQQEMKPEAKSQTLVVQTELAQIGEITTIISNPNTGTLKADDIAQIKHDYDVEKRPEDVNSQKLNKSPKPHHLDVASSSRSIQDSDENILNVEDIIIIQAEVVSDEKAKQGETCTSCEDHSNKKDKKTDVKHSEKSKKRKKSPNPPQRERKQEINVEPQGEIQIPVSPMPKDKNAENAVVELEPPKIDSIPSPNEVTPDFIEYPRSSSEQLDDNNNMVIQEISPPDLHIEAPINIPETPFSQSENVGSAKSIIVEPKNEEKTDLKSKVLEVNQDMEELRLSIERSLAELTSLEKTDRDMEKNMKEQNVEGVLNIKQLEVMQVVPAEESPPDSTQNLNLILENKEEEVKSCQGPVCPARKDPKGKGKSKKKGKHESTLQNSSSQPSGTATSAEILATTHTEDKNKDNKSEQSSDATQEKEHQKSETKVNKDDDVSVNDNYGKDNQPQFEPIENFEDAMTSSVGDVNKTFEVIANEANSRLTGSQNNPEINVIAPQEDENGNRQEKQNPVSPPKNLLGHPDIPVPSSRTDYKKEKDKSPNCRQAKVKIKDANQAKIETPEKSKESPGSKPKCLNFKKPDESICVTNQNDDYVYKYSFRKVFLQCSCHVCKKDLKQTRVPCSYCNLIFYCSQKHKDEDYSQHQALCFAVSTIVHLKDQKFMYADSRNVTGHNYRLLRMQMIVSCEKVLKRKLTAWEQEALLYPRMCADASCREWRLDKLVDCEGCGQISYCSEHPEHLPKSHSRWCKSYNLYRGLVKHQQTKGRLEPKLPTRVLELSPLPDNINEVLAAMYEEKIEMSDIEYAALTQLATAPLTALFCLQFRPNTANGLTKKSSLTLHIVGAELQFEADVLNKWEVFLLHLIPHIEELRVVLVGPDLNPSNLPLELLGKIKHCDHCQRKKRRVVFDFQDKRTYHEFWASEDFTTPDLVCAFNPSIQRSSAYNGKDTWPATINCVFKLKVPLVVTSYTLSELTSDLLRIQECATVGYNVICAPRNNSFSSVRPDRNFISDDEAPLLFKNHCVTVVCGV